MRPIPHNSLLRIIWNVLMLATILSFSFIITYRMAFQTFRADGLYYLLNGLLFLDVLMGFCTSVKRGHIRLDSFPEIRNNYLRGWFTIDLLSFLPFELVPLLIFGGVPGNPVASQVYMVLQIFTLIKLLKALRIFNELQEALALPPAVRRLANFGYWFAQAIHLMSLGWILIGASEGHRPHFDQYLRSLYWATTTIATIGYGDYLPDHESNLQIIYTIVVQIFGVGMYTFVIANVSSLVANLDVARSAFQRHMEEVNAYLRAQRIPPALQERVRDYYSYLWSSRRSSQARPVIDDLPQSLGLEILLHQNRDLIRRLDIFRDADELFVREAVKMLRPRVFLPGEHIIRQGENADAMYFLLSGEVAVLVGEHQVARLGPGSAFGETALVKAERRNASVISECYGSGYQLSRQDFLDLRTKYPEFDNRVHAIVAQRENK